MAFRLRKIGGKEALPFDRLCLASMSDGILKMPENADLIVCSSIIDNNDSKNPYLGRCFLAKGDIVIVLQKCDLRYTLFDLDQKRNKIQCILNHTGLLTNNQYTECAKVKKILSKEKVMYGYRIFSPKHQVDLWISDVDFGCLLEID
jgi:hypothetical protein